MDISLLRNRTHQFKSLLASIAGIQKNGSNSKANPEIVSLFRGITLLLIAILLAWICKTETENRTRDKVLNSEWPPATVWTGVLTQGGWKRIENPDLSGLLKYHPDPFSPQPCIWESEDHCYLYLNSSPYQQEHSMNEFWSCASGQKSPKNLKWHKIGGGYSGVNLVSKISSLKPKKTVSYIDPKEIRY